MIKFNAGSDGDYYDVQLHARLRRLQMPRLSFNGLARAALRLRRLIVAVIALLAVLLQLLAMVGYRI